ncbi:MAG: potassium transporter TrkG, partial [Arsenophonus sp. NC-QC1-MAG3]
KVGVKRTSKVNTSNRPNSMVTIRIHFPVGFMVDEFSAFTSIAATLNNLGTGLGSVAENFTSMNSTGKWILIVTMLFGRLEVFTLLVLFTPTFWRE